MAKNAAGHEEVQQLTSQLAQAGQELQVLQVKTPALLFTSLQSVLACIIEPERTWQNLAVTRTSMVGMANRAIGTGLLSLLKIFTDQRELLLTTTVHQSVLLLPLLLQLFAK